MAPPTVSAPAPSDHATEATEDEELSRALRDSLAFEQEDFRRRQEEDEALLAVSYTHLTLPTTPYV